MKDRHSMPKAIIFKNSTGDANLNNSKQQFQWSTGKTRSVEVFQAKLKSVSTKIFLGVSPIPTEPDALFHKEHILHISESESSR